MPDTGSPYNLPYPDLDDIPDIPSDFKGLADRVSAVLGGIDADDPANLQGLPTTGQPLAFYGSGRPDDAGLNLSAPTGSTYTFKGTQSELDAVFGARMWRKGVTNWVCVEGETPRYAWEGVGVCRYSESIYFGMQQTTSKFENWSVTMPDSRWCPTETCDVGLYQTSYSFNCGHVGISINGQIVARYALPAGANGANAAQFYAVGICVQPWPTAPPPGARTLDELRELIEAAQSPDHPQHDQLQELRDELAALTGTKPGDGGA